ncbi:MAG TPA: MBL fold metallo-hydrolase [Candidatus Saccharimonadales bacterium]|nr:MBL fold metallo-hydrolase [Candidatus Saccharimonadales bacterium]
MKITKFVHSCLLVETPERAALFDPGTLSESALDVGKLERLDDIFITHEHADHFSLDLIKLLVKKFPDVRITSTSSVVKQLDEAGITASDQPPAGVEFFESPHEDVAPMFGQPPEEIGINYLGVLSDPGDSHSFTGTKEILALPITAPWGSSIKALNLALRLKPKHVLPIHDWHWRDEARQQTYDSYGRILGDNGITFHKLQTGIPVEISVNTDTV